MSQETFEISKRENVDQEKMLAVLGRALAEVAFAEQLFADPEQALGSFGLNQKERAVLKAITREHLAEARQAAEALLAQAADADVAGQSAGEGAGGKGAKMALGRAMLETLGGRSVGGHWDGGTAAGLAACCGWHPCFG